MKRFLTILLTTLALAGLPWVPASAASFDGPAAALAAIGMPKASASEGTSGTSPGSIMRALFTPKPRQRRP